MLHSRIGFGSPREFPIRDEISDDSIPSELDARWPDDGLA